MIRVIYRWKVPPSARADFLQRWRRVTNTIHREVDGALGSFCLQGIADEGELLTVALWRTEEQWRRFIADAGTTRMQPLHEIATQLSATPYRQLGDETVSP